MSLPPEIMFMILNEMDDMTLYKCLLTSRSFDLLSKRDLLDRQVRYCLRKSTTFRKTPYIYAIQKGWLEVCEVLLNKGYSLCHPRLGGFLHTDDLYAESLKYKRSTIQRWLIEKGYSPTEKSLYQCIENKDLETYKYLREGLNVEGNIVRIHYDSITNGALDILRYIRQEINLVPYIDYGLVSAVRSRSLDMVRYVWNEVHLTNNKIIKGYFTMAIFHAIILNEYEILDFLLDRDLCIGIITYHDVIRRGDVAMLSHLMKRGRLCPWVTIDDLIMLWNCKGPEVTETISRLLVSQNCQIYGFDRVEIEKLDMDMLLVLEEAKLMDNSTYFNR